MIETINKAKARRDIEEPLILHSDRGSQYVSKEYKRVTADMQCSYSKKAYPWDNACMESIEKGRSINEKKKMKKKGNKSL